MNKTLIFLCIVWAILGGLVTHFLLFPCPEVSDSRIVERDTVYVPDTVIVVPPPVVKTITEFENVPAPGSPPPEPEIENTYESYPGQGGIIIGSTIKAPYVRASKEFPEGKVELRIYPMVELDSIRIKFSPTPLEIICRDMIVTVDSIQVITVTKETGFWKKLAIFGGGVAGGILLMEFAQ